MCFSPYLGLRSGGLVYNVHMQFRNLGSSKIEVFETRFFYTTLETYVKTNMVTFHF